MGKSSVTAGQIKQFLNLFEGVVRKSTASLGITKEAMQSAIEKGGELIEKVEPMIVDLLRYEEYLQTIKNAGYCLYSKPKEVVEQIRTLRKFSSLEILTTLAKAGVGSDPYISEEDLCLVSSVLSDTRLDIKIEKDVFKKSFPKKAEGSFALIRWEIFASQYGKAVQIMMRLIELQRDCKFHNYLGYNKDKDFESLIQCDELVESWNKIYKDQKNSNVLIIPAQFGLCYKNFWYNRLFSSMDANEFPLGVFHTLVMILTHPERFSSEGDLWIFCPGDKYIGGSNNVVGISYVAEKGNFSLDSFREDAFTTRHGQMTGWFVETNPE